MMITIVCKVSHKSLSNKNHHAFSSGYSFSKSMIEVLPFFRLLAIKVFKQL